MFYEVQQSILVTWREISHFMMQCLPNDKIFEFHADTLEAVRKTYSLDKPGEMAKAVDILEEWVQQQNHLTKKDYNRGYLERKIIGCKGSVERAKERLDKICTFRTLMPQYFGDFDIRNDFKALDVLQCAMYPKLTKDHQRIFFCKCVAQKFETTFLLESFKYMFLCMECLKAHDYSKGYLVILDFVDVNWIDILNKLHVNVLRQGLTIMLGGYETRLSAVHILSKSNLVDLAVAAIKPFISDKLASRIYTHSTVEAVFETIPKDMFPIEYGGKEKPLSELHEQWRNVLGSKEQRQCVREICTARTDESLRQTDTFNEMYMGTPGTFRTLNVD